jgi:hypothetical protein
MIKSDPFARTKFEVDPIIIGEYAKAQSLLLVCYFGGYFVDVG